MKGKSRYIIKTGAGSDVAFALVVMASYFGTFSALTDAKVIEIILMIGLGITYIAIGIYGYAFCGRSNKMSWNLIYFAIQITLGGIIVYLGKGAGYNAMILLPLAAHGVILLSQGLMVITNVLLALIYMTNMVLLNQGWTMIWSGLPTFIAGQVFIVFFTQIAVSEEKARIEVERLVNELASANQRLRENASQIEELAITKERNRMAREIHDGLGHYLTTVHMQIQAARAIMKSDMNRADMALKTAQNVTKEALADVRRSVAALRSLDDDKKPLLDKITQLTKHIEGTGVSVDFSVTGEPRELSPQVQLMLFRAVQEGLNNALKYAQATKVLVTLDFQDSSVARLLVKDDGLGAENMEGGYGLLGLQERVHSLNGLIEVHTEKGQGFTLDIKVPG
jgi:signal transduction histidine kinase